MKRTNNELKIIIGRRINFIRLQNNMSKEEFAKYLGITPQHLGKVLSGASCLSIEKIVKLSKKSGYPTDYILLGKEASFEKNVNEIIKHSIESTEESLTNLKKLQLLNK